MKRHNFLLISTGDPAGIGPETCIKTIKEMKKIPGIKIIPVGNFDILYEAMELCGYSMPIVKIDSIDEVRDFDSYYEILNVKSEKHIEKGKVSFEAGIHTINILKTCSDLCVSGKARGVVTGPINKESLKLAGYEGGHTEIFKGLTGVSSVDTIFCIENLKIFFLSRHVSLKDGISLVTKENLVKALINMDKIMKSLGYETPVLGLPGLNPHCSDGGLFGKEETDVMIPAVNEAREKGINVKGPIGADSIYHLGIKGEFDAILSLYHDQGHIASKTYDFYKTITMSVGLPYLRTSVDHGTGFDIAWKNMANPVSLIKAIELAVELMKSEK
jgi:4-hydroxythreonine-4-phosphate dehydrogenase